MATLRFLLKRFFAQRLLGLAVVTTLAFSIGVLVAGPIYADAAREAILSSEVTSAAVTVKNARLQTFGDAAFDWTAADRAVTDAVSELPIDTIVRQGLATVRLGTTGGPSVPIVFRDGIEGHLAIRGDAPTGDEILIHVGTARSLGLQRGDRVAIIGPTELDRELVVSGTYESPDGDEPFWFGSQNPFPDPDSTQPQPVIVPRDTLLRATSELELTTQFAWDAYLDLRGLPFERAEDVPGRGGGGVCRVWQLR
jgi:hypothetical protein